MKKIRRTVRSDEKLFDVLRTDVFGKKRAIHFPTMCRVALIFIQLTQAFACRENFLFISEVLGSDYLFYYYLMLEMLGLEVFWKYFFFLFSLHELYLNDELIITKIMYHT